MRSEDTGISRRKFLVASTGAGAGLVGLKNSTKAQSRGSKHEGSRIRVAACQILTYPDLEKSVKKIILLCNG